MNIYELNEDGERVIVQAKTMYDAIEDAEDFYITELRDDDGNAAEVESFSEANELGYYREQILLSCRLIGKLRMQRT